MAAQARKVVQASAPRLIGLHGRKTSGKDTAAGFIDEWAQENGLSSATRYFAGSMKRSIAALLEIPLEHVDVFKLEGKCEISYPDPDLPGGLKYQVIDGRTWLQNYGTESHRDIFGWDFWIDQLLPLPTTGRPESLPAWWTNFNVRPIAIIADVRFENEILRTRELGGDVWLIKRDSVESDGHRSEQLFPELCTHVVDNNGSLDDLRDAVRGILPSSLP